MAASPVIAGDHVYAMGRAGKEDQVLCLDLTRGDVVWRKSYEARSDGRYRKGESPEGPTCTPSYDAATGLLYALAKILPGTHGRSRST